MIVNNKPVILIRVLNGIGIDNKGRGYLLDGTPVKRSYYGGRICYRINKTVVGYRSLANSPAVKLEVNKLDGCPF